ncbi:uncharacterized protein N0V89_010405 [Didymosphaeria variabile]|uniref:Zona occludens toxin N-terminal domain-containing protein n=1 Tax=Didymosphaeria variabile TaxID=1932322 RepID=A0A9W9C636_9PLEO|nr:uncharacterized protein N0V89_010405 [Didymosphaeria variabile]KAJ4346476.1 hypothetical protein N0V89_010405 [Didymosphaeria variabile]
MAPSFNFGEAMAAPFEFGGSSFADFEFSTFTPAKAADKTAATDTGVDCLSTRSYASPGELASSSFYPSSLAAVKTVLNHGVLTLPSSASQAPVIEAETKPSAKQAAVSAKTYTKAQIDQWITSEFHIRYVDVDGRFDIETGTDSLLIQASIEKSISGYRDKFHTAQAIAANLTWTTSRNQEDNRRMIINGLSLKYAGTSLEYIEAVARNVEVEHARLRRKENRQLQRTRRRQEVCQKEDERLQLERSAQDSDHDLVLGELQSEDGMAKKKSQRPSAWFPKPWPTFDPSLTDASFNRATQDGPRGSDAWVQWHYCTNAFESDGTFKGWNSLKRHLVSLSDDQISSMAISQTVKNLRLNLDSAPYSLPMLDSDGKPMEGEIQKIFLKRPVPLSTATGPNSVVAHARSETHGAPETTTPSPPLAERSDLLQRQLGQMRLDVHTDQRESSLMNSSDAPEEDSLNAGAMVDLDAMDVLLTDDSFTDGSGTDHQAEIRHAPLADEGIFRSRSTISLIPQFGLMGTHDQNIDNASSKLFLNTNVPFSAFVCGVQGSGKSHTTSCILENCLIPSKNLGVLQEPLSALVFSYGLFTGDGAGFSISEAAFLGAPIPRLGNAHVKKIHVLVCDTNLRRIRKLYERLPNVTVSAFKLNPRNLDIDLMLTLMNVSESDRMPLYMGAILQIIREMATTSDRFDYRVFKERVRGQRFSPDQENMLKIRLDLLESFLDLQGTNRDDMLFKPGEITIMDMSCPFVDSRASGKLVVLDEAHKYMLDVPGAKGLNQALVDTIRMQRHTGTRVVVSTQEPTLLTDLIALCSVAVIHRFSSPEWFTAIKRHIRIPEADREALMERIEGLSTGTAIVYSPNSILGYVDGSIKKGTGTMTKVKMRKRITADGGQSVLAV